MVFEVQKRQGVFVYLYHLKQSKQLRRYGSIQYVSRKMKYVLIYMNQKEIDVNVKKLEQLRYVKEVIVSPRPEITTTYNNTLGRFKLTEEDQEKFKNKEWKI
ncbi:YlbG family protein [Ligilactobacillus sp. WILCCON 0076]|uniref:UPF0298 protein LB941_03795 n=1 Tax=Ligilactobacillus ubinensis TaxID=2876789 RepID=A0A9X2FI72_9LACO|nr:YlbG family protein [Ligilactobacillus ubinensis]MCP0886459.1 YlbG family protein [Ligilactobacillus ubinensis]